MDSRSPNAKQKDCQVPATPEAVEENGDFELQSPLTLTVVRKQLNETSIHSGPNDSFAPPLPKAGKHLEDSRSSVVRRLPFRADSLSDQRIFESLYDDLYQFVLSKQLEEGPLSLKSNVQQDEDEDEDECKSPPPHLRFSGIAHTCPPAPRKLKHQPKPILMELCKKLQF